MEEKSKGHEASITPLQRILSDKNMKRHNYHTSMYFYCLYYGSKFGLH